MEIAHRHGQPFEFIRLEDTGDQARPGGERLGHRSGESRVAAVRQAEGEGLGRLEILFLVDFQFLVGEAGFIVLYALTVDAGKYGAARDAETFKGRTGIDEAYAQVVVVIVLHGLAEADAPGTAQYAGFFGYIVIFVAHPAPAVLLVEEGVEIVVDIVGGRVDLRIAVNHVVAPVIEDIHALCTEIALGIVRILRIETRASLQHRQHRDDKGKNDREKDGFSLHNRFNCKGILLTLQR